MAVTRKVLFRDGDGYEVVLLVERDGEGRAKRWVEYGRYPQLRYEYLTAEEGAARVLAGKALKRCYLSALSREHLLQVEEKAKAGGIGRSKTGRVVFLRNRIVVQECLIETLDLSGLVLEEGINLGDAESMTAQICPTHILRGANFTTTRFIKKAHFNRVFFWGKASFERATFNADADFWGAHFGADAIFSSATFRGEATFWGATFSADSYFRNSIYRADAVFTNTSFTGRADFWSAIFISNATFRNASFVSRASFWGATFCLSANFNAASFNTASFSHACFLEANFTESRFEKTADLSHIGAGLLSLRRSVFAANLIISTPPEKFEHKKRVIARGIEIWQQRLKRRSVAEDSPESRRLKRYLQTLNDWRNSQHDIHSADFENTLVSGELRCPFSLIHPQHSPPILVPYRQKNWSAAQRQFAWLKEQYRKQGAYDDEDEAHWWASECNRMQTPTSLFSKDLIKGSSLPPLRLLLTTLLCLLLAAGTIFSFLKAENPLNITPQMVLLAIATAALLFPRWGYMLIFRDVLGYGVRPWCIITTAFLVILTCGALFAIADSLNLLSYDNPAILQTPWFRGLYVSVITYTTVGYGDITPTGWATGLSMVEGILGVVLNAALVVVIFRKLIR